MAADAKRRLFRKLNACPRRRGAWAAVCLILTAGILVAFQTEEPDRIPCGSGPPACQECHRQESLPAGLVIPRDGCSSYCGSCHKNQKTMHKVGAGVKGKIPESVRLSSKSHIQCNSCHRLEGKRFDLVPWKAESLYDSIFRRKTVHKTYFLAMRNHKGQLCRVCH